jgi:hypothetical protein
VAHLPAGAGLALVIEVKRGAWFGDEIRPSFYVRTDKVLHRGARGDQAEVAKRQAEDGAEVLFELRGFRAF